MIHFVLIRPGATDFDEQGRVQGRLDVPLSSTGNQCVQQLIAAMRGLGIGAIYHAPCEAARVTAEAIGESLGIRSRQLDTLHNLDHGLWQGMLLEDIKRKHPKVYRQWQEQPKIICPPEGEMFGEAMERVQTALNKLMKKHKKGTVAVVVPEPLTSIVHSYLTHSDLQHVWKNRGVCGSWEMLAIESHPLIFRGVEC